MANTAPMDNVWLVLLENIAPPQLSLAAAPSGPGLQPSTSSAEPAPMAIAARQPAHQYLVLPTNMLTTFLASLVLLALNVWISTPNLLADQDGSVNQLLEPVPSALKEVSARRQTRKPSHVRPAHFLKLELPLASHVQRERLALEQAQQDQLPRSRYALLANKGCLKRMEAEPAHQQLMVSMPCRLMLLPKSVQLVSTPQPLDKLLVILHRPHNKQKPLLARKAQSL